MAPLPPLFPAEEVTRTSFERDDLPRQRRMGEPGTWHDQVRSDYDTGVLPAQKHIMSSTLGGANTAPQEWTVEVIPLLGRHGAAGADWIGPATITGVADGGTLEDMVDILVAAAATSATLTDQADITAWKRFRSIVVLSKDGVTPEKLVATSFVTGQTFDLVITPGAAGSATAPAVDQNGDPTLSTITAGTYVTVTGRDSLGRLKIRVPAAGDVSAGLVGPVMLDQGSEAVDTGYGKRVYRSGTNIPLAKYGDPRAYGESAIGTGATPGDKAANAAASLVYVRLVAADPLEGGMVTDVAGASAAATAQVDDITPTAADATYFALQVSIDGVILGTIQFTSGIGATQTTISDGLKVNLTDQAAIFGGIITADAAGSAVTELTGPADGRTVVYTDVGEGILGIANTAAAVQTHILAPRGEKFVVNTRKIGGAPVGIPHP